MVQFAPHSFEAKALKHLNHFRSEPSTPKAAPFESELRAKALAGHLGLDPTVNIEGY